MTEDPPALIDRVRPILRELGHSYLVAGAVLAPVFLVLWALGGDRRTAFGYAALVAGGVMLFAGAGLVGRTTGMEVPRTPVQKFHRGGTGREPKRAANLTSVMISNLVGLPLIVLGGLVL